jgi:cytosine/adenosine deaminase-related metal-dependent hydrolase
MELMKGLGEIARKHDLSIQTHVSESKPDTDWVPYLRALDTRLTFQQEIRYLNIEIYFPKY